jgi:hypothetical protein
MRMPWFGRTLKHSSAAVAEKATKLPKANLPTLKRGAGEFVLSADANEWSRLILINPSLTALG